MLLVASGATLAHDGGPRLILEPAKVNPGGVVVIRGEDLGADHELRLALIGAGTETDLATVTSDGEGHFTVAVQISTDAPRGGYAVSATTSDGGNIRAAMVVEGSPLGGGEGAPPGQDEGLPQIAPSAGRQAAPGRIATVESLPPATRATAAPGSPANSTSASADADLVPLVALVGAVAALGLLFWRTRRPRSVTGSSDPS